MKEKHSIIRWKGLLFAMLWALSLGVFAQNITVKGNVKDDAGLEVIGATIVVEGNAAIGTITDADGNYVLNNVPSNVNLVFSYVGMKSQTVPVNGRTVIDLVMKTDTELLDEVVVVGYTVTSKRALISSVSTVNAEQMEALPVTNITQGLAGRSPGLIVVGNGGGINKMQNLSIRGGGTPLVVIDGIIRDYNDFVTLSPEDIEGMSILKDASATAVYGSRATNGILQITTKGGRLGKPALTYSFNQSWSQPAIWSKKMDLWDRASYANIGRKNDGLDPMFGEDALKAMKDGSDPLNYPNTDWRGLVLKDWAPQAKHSIQLTGGTEANRYFISLGHINQNSLYKINNHYLKQTNFRLSQTSTIESIGLTSSATIDGYLQETSHPYTSTSSGYYQVFSHIQNKSPLEKGVNKFGLPYDTADNPVGETAADVGYNKENKRNINGNLQLRWAL
ncbi:MAG: SusC/RagA family TonB-linked outer membrane protein [Bacteroidia bacterium]|nr:SusC/RagA family TonB-linked outer membrane protein [Bacteroidia bacterium]